MLPSVTVTKFIEFSLHITPRSRVPAAPEPHNLFVLYHAVQGLLYGLIAVSRARQALEYLVNGERPLFFLEELHNSLPIL